VAENGAQALDMLAMQRYDVVFMDCQMPVLDGYEATRRIRAGRVPNLDPNLPVIAFTSYATEGDRQKCIAAGMDDMVVKPIRFEDFQAVLERRVVKAGERHIMASDSQIPFQVRVAVLDRSRLEHLYGREEGDEEFIRTLIDLFLAETPRRLDDIRAARARGDLRSVANITQTIQGAAANLGARSLEQHCQRIDALAQSGRLVELDPLIAGLDEELARLASALDKQKQKASIENTHR
jgi:CheY-like chemotaxis protein/HPt (histidine-containing phosphotransfer) domain-containing protein